MTVRERFAKLLRESGVSQSEVGRRIGESPSWVNDRLKGRTQINADDVCRLASAMELPIAAFFQGCDSADEMGEAIYAAARVFRVTPEQVKTGRFRMALDEPSRAAGPGGTETTAERFAQRAAEIAVAKVEDRAEQRIREAVREELRALLSGVAGPQVTETGPTEEGEPRPTIAQVYMRRRVEGFYGLTEEQQEEVWAHVEERKRKEGAGKQ